jgi:hypothetical protein
LEEALYWFKKGAELENPNSAFNAALAFANGTGCLVDYVAARAYYELAARGGLSQADQNLGVLFYEGKGGEVQKDEALRCFKSGSLRGSFLSSGSVSNMNEKAEVLDLGLQKPIAFAYLLIAERQAEKLGHKEDQIVVLKKEKQSTLTDDEIYEAISFLEINWETLPEVVPEVLVEFFKTRELTEANKLKADYWQRIVHKSETSELMKPQDFTTHSNLNSIPKVTAEFVDRLPALGFTQRQVHGLFVLSGLYIGSPTSQEELDQHATAFAEILPTDRNLIIDHLVSDYFEEYISQLEELCYRSGLEFGFQPVIVDGVTTSWSLLTPRNHGLLNAEVKEISNLAATSKLFGSLLEALGESTFRQSRSLKEAHLAGVYQMQLMAIADNAAAQQVRRLLMDLSPLVIGYIFRSIIGNRLEYFLGLLPEQVYPVSPSWT